MNSSEGFIRRPHCARDGYQFSYHTTGSSLVIVDQEKHSLSPSCNLVELRICTCVDLPLLGSGFVGGAVLGLFSKTRDGILAAFEDTARLGCLRNEPNGKGVFNCSSFSLSFISCRTIPAEESQNGKLLVVRNDTQLPMLMNAKHCHNRERINCLTLVNRSNLMRECSKWFSFWK